VFVQKIEDREKQGRLRVD